MASKQFDIEVNGSVISARSLGSGSPVVLFYGYGGVPHTSRFEEVLARSHRVTTIPLPGQQGSDRGHDKLHSPLDWVTAALDAIENAVGTDEPIHLVAQSVAGMLAGEIGAISPRWLRSVTLIGPLGLYDDADPPRNPFAEAPPHRVPLMTRKPDLFKATYGAPESLSAEERHEYEVIAYRADEATARLMWPFGDIGLKRRLHRIKVPVQIIWGSADELVPAAYAERFAQGLKNSVKIELIEDSGHLVALEAPEKCAALVKGFVREPALSA
jgi:pimeloyl-ACP methyl ester carboxylesterase